MKLNGKISEAIKLWLRKGVSYTVEESKVLGVRAQEAGQLTKFNAKRYKLRKEYDDICIQLGQQVLDFSDIRKKGNIQDSPKIQELIGKASQVMKELKLLDDEIEYYKKECDNKVKEIHRRAA